jgi:hypothetical protein
VAAQDEELLAEESVLRDQLRSRPHAVAHQAADLEDAVTADERAEDEGAPRTDLRLHALHLVVLAVVAIVAARSLAAQGAARQTS